MADTSDDAVEKLIAFHALSSESGAADTAAMLLALLGERDRLQQERDRLAADLAQAHRDIGPWIARVGQLIAALDQAEQAMREAGAIYGADAALAALRKEIKA
jgi:hypothetical protein